MRIEKDLTIGVVIDIQERLFPVIAEKEELLKNCEILIAGLKTLSVPVVVTQQYTKGLGDTLSEIKQLIEPFNAVEKTSFSCFDEPRFVEELENSKAKNIIICGIEAHICVLQTAVDLKAAGYNPIVVFDCVSSRCEKNKQIVMERFRYENIMVTSCESLLFELTKSAKSPEFKEISRLVK